MIQNSPRGVGLNLNPFKPKSCRIRKIWIGIIENFYLEIVGNPQPLNNFVIDINHGVFIQSIM